MHERDPASFAELVGEYRRLLEEYIDQLLLKKSKPRARMEHVVTRLGEAAGGPRDLLEVHVEALDQMVKGQDLGRARSLAIEGRLLALEMMGHLVEYYRVGQRRRLPGKGGS